jgi:hypothetical protein
MLSVQRPGGCGRQCESKSPCASDYAPASTMVVGEVDLEKNLETRWEGGRERRHAAGTVADAADARVARGRQSSAAMRRSRSATACSSMARCAAAHAICRSASARVRASISVARCARRAASSGATGGATRRASAAASCCASTDLLSQPLAIRCASVLTKARTPARTHRRIGKAATGEFVIRPCRSRMKSRPRTTSAVFFSAPTNGSALTALSSVPPIKPFRRMAEPRPTSAMAAPSHGIERVSRVRSRRCPYRSACR